MSKIKDNLLLAVAVLSGILGVAFGITQSSSRHDDYPGYERTAFLASCIGGSSFNPRQHEFCHCALDDIQESYSYAEFSTMLEQADPRLKEDMQARSEKCVKKARELQIQQIPSGTSGVPL